MEKNQAAYYPILDRLEKATTREGRLAALLEEVVVSELFDYDDFVRDMWFYEPSAHGGCPDLSYSGNKLSGECGEVNDKIGKAYRDSDGKIVDEDAFMRELGDVLFYVAHLAHSVGKVLEDVASMNKVKLLDRKARGTLRGDGDDR